MQDIGTDNAPIQTKLAAARICMELGLLPDEQLISQFDKLLAEDTAPSRLADLHETVSEVEKELMRWCEDCTE